MLFNWALPAVIFGVYGGVGEINGQVKISDLQAARIVRYVIRLPTNFPARRNFLPEHHNGRIPKYGALVRPLPRQHKGKTLEASLPDETYTWVEHGREMRVEIWRTRVLIQTAPDENNATFDV